METVLFSGSISHPSWIPFAIHCSIFRLSSARLVRGTQFDDEVWTERSVAGLLCLRKRIPSTARDPGGGIGSAHGAVGQAESSIRVEGDAAPVGFSPFIEESRDPAVHVAGLASCGCRHENLSVGIAFHTHSIVSRAEAHQFLVAHRLFRPEANRKGHLCQGEVHSRSVLEQPSHAKSTISRLRRSSAWRNQRRSSRG